LIIGLFDVVVVMDLMLGRISWVRLVMVWKIMHITIHG